MKNFPDAPANPGPERPQLHLKNRPPPAAARTYAGTINTTGMKVIPADSTALRHPLRLKNHPPGAADTLTGTEFVASHDEKVEPDKALRKEIKKRHKEENGKRSRRGGKGLIHLRRVAAWALFFALGWLMYQMRYEGLNHMTGEIKAYGPWIMLAFHVLLIMLAFEDDIFLGCMCLFVPGYTLYYLFAHSGRVFLMAFIAGLLVGTGEDTFYALLKVWDEVYKTGTSLLSRPK